MKPILQAFSDFHLNDWQNFNEGNKRINAQKKILEIIKEESLKLGVPTLFAGDFIHKPKSISNGLLEYILKELNPLFNGWTIYGISGNHDQSSTNDLTRKSPSWWENLSLINSNIKCLDFKSAIVGNLKIFGIPSITHDRDFDVAILKMAEGIDNNMTNILMVHTILPNTKDNDGRLLSSENINDNIYELLHKFDLVIAGDVHKPQKLSSKVFMMGSPMQLRKSDEGSELGYWVFYQKEKSIIGKFNPIKGLPEFKSYSGDTPPDDFHFWSPEKKLELEKSENSVDNQISSSDDRGELVDKYFKYNGYKNRIRKRILIQILKDD